MIKKVKMNGVINLKSIIKKSNIKKEYIACELFPENKFPIMALDRVIRGDSELDSKQISKLASLLDVSIDQLFNNNWKGKSNNKSIVFEKGEYRAELSISKWITRIYHNESLFHETVMIPDFIKLSDYINMLDEIINNYKEKENE